MSRRRLARPPRAAQVDWTHPLARGLTNLYYGGVDYVPVKQRLHSSGVPPAPGRLGYLSDIFTYGVNSYVDLGVGPGATGPMTFVFWVWFTSAPPTVDAVISIGDGATFRFDGFQFYTYNGAGTYSGATFTGQGAGLYRLVCTHTGSANTVVGFGPTAAINASTAAPARNSGNYNLRLGADAQNSRSSNCQVLFAAAYNRALSTDEGRAVLLNPWQLLESPARLVVTDVPAGGAVLVPAAATLALNGPAPTLAQTANQALSPAPAALVLAGPAAALARTANQNLTPTAGALVLSGPGATLAQTANVSLTPAAAALTLSGPAPTISQTAGVNLTPGSAALIIAGPAPTLTRTANVALVPGAAALVLAGPATSLSQGGAVNLSPAPAALTLSGPVAALARTANQNLTPAAGAIVLAGPAPTIQQPKNLTPAVRAIVLAGPAVTLTRTANVSLVPAPAALTVVGPAPTVTRSSNVTLTPAPAALVLAGPAASVVILPPVIITGPTKWVYTMLPAARRAATIPAHRRISVLPGQRRIFKVPTR